MEDAHLTVQIDLDTCAFGVFDGHGGKEVAIYVAKHFTDFFKRSQNYKLKKYDDALQETFLSLDRSMETPAVMKEL